MKNIFINHSIIALFLFCTLSACHSRPASIYKQYEKVEIGNLSIFDGVAIDEGRNLLVDYARPFSKDVFDLERDFGVAYFEYENRSGVFIEHSTRISVHEEIDTVREWRSFNAVCEARKIIQNYIIVCKNEKREWQYTYSPKIGILDMDLLCESGRLCRYELKTAEGIFSESALKKVKLKSE